MLVGEILAIKGKVVHTVAPGKRLGEAVDIMTEQDVGSVVVFSHGQMAGMLTFREVLRAVQRGGMDWADVPVADAMLETPLTASPDMEVDELRRMMVDHRQRYLPVLDGGVLMGVVSFHDVAKAALEAQSVENRMLRNYIRDWPPEDGEA